jgi:hypothetical protein
MTILTFETFIRKKTAIEAVTAGLHYEEYKYPYLKSRHGTFILYFLVCFGLLCLKSLDAITNPQFWAEDGAIFYAQQAVSHWPQFTRAYAGYLHLVPRAVAWLTSGIDPLYLPLVYNVSAILIDAACLTYSIVVLSPIVGTGLAFVSFFLLPTAGDIFGTLTNVQWFLQFPLALCLLRPGSSKYAAAGAAKTWLFIIVACLTGPFCLIMTPILIGLFLLGAVNVLEIAARRQPVFAKFADAFEGLLERIPRGRMIALVIGTVLQGTVVAFHVTIHRISTPIAEYVMTPQELIKFNLTGKFHPYVQIVTSPTSHFQLALVMVFAVAVVTIMVMIWLRSNRIFLMMAVLMFIGGLQPILAFLKQHASYMLASSSHYFYFLGVFSFCAIGLAIKQLPRIYRISASTALLSVLVCTLFLHPEYLSRAYLTPLHWRHYADQIKRGNKDVVVPLNPNWRVVMPGEARPIAGSRRSRIDQHLTYDVLRDR